MTLKGLPRKSLQLGSIGIIGTTFFLSFLVGILADLLGLRCTALLGALLASLGMGLSATFPHSYPVLFPTSSTYPRSSLFLSALPSLHPAPLTHAHSRHPTPKKKTKKPKTNPKHDQRTCGQPKDQRNQRRL